MSVDDVVGAYVSRKTCGCVGLMVVDDGGETARYVAAAIRRGEAVDRMSVEQARATRLRCEAHRVPRQERQGGLL